MYQKERIHLIYSTLKMKQFLSSQEIMSLCNTSRDTARRDMILMPLILIAKKKIHTYFS